LNCWYDDGDYIHKPMFQCTGEELCAEWLYHIGIPVDHIDALAKECNTTPCMMPYVTSFFEPRAYGDRPLVVPVGSVNLAFVGQYAETPRDTVFTTEYSIRTAMEAVYTLCDVDRGVPEVWGSVFDIRELIKAGVKMNDGKMIKDWPLAAPEKAAISGAFKLIANTELSKLLINLGAAEKADFAPLVDVDQIKDTLQEKAAEVKDQQFISKLQ
jgi:oleate hydratase